MTLAYFTCLSLLPIIPQPPTLPPFLLPPHRFPLTLRPPPPQASPSFRCCLPPARRWRCPRRRRGR